MVTARSVGRDALAAFEGGQYSVPFRLIGETVEISAVAGVVRVPKDSAIFACHPPETERRIVIDQRHYDGPSTERVIAPPPPLGRTPGSKTRLHSGGSALDRPLRRAGGRCAML